jgi:hypothetical protein
MNDHQSTQAGATTLEPRTSKTFSPTFPSKDTPLSPSCPTRSQIKSSLQILQHNRSNITSVKKEGVLHARETYRLSSIVI